MKTVMCDYCKKPIDTVEQNIELHISCAVFPENNKRLDLHRGTCFNIFLRRFKSALEPEKQKLSNSEIPDPMLSPPRIPE